MHLSQKYRDEKENLSPLEIMRVGKEIDARILFLELNFYMVKD